MLLPGLLWAAPKADLWERWQAHDPDSRLSVDHTPWPAFLETYLVQGEDGINLYNALTVQVILDHFPVDSIREIDGYRYDWSLNQP